MIYDDRAIKDLTRVLKDVLHEIKGMRKDMRGYFGEAEVPLDKPEGEIYNPFEVLDELL